MQGMRPLHGEKCILKRTDTFNRKWYGLDEVEGEDWSVPVASRLQDKISSRKSEILVLDFPFNRLQFGCTSAKLRKVSLF